MPGNADLLLLLAPLAPGLAGLVILALAPAPRLAVAIGLAGALAALLLVLPLAVEWEDKEAAGLVLAPFVPGSPLRLVLDPSGLLLALTAGTLMPLLLAALGTQPGRCGLGSAEIALMMLHEGATLALAFAANLVTLLAFAEVQGLLGYALLRRGGLGGPAAPLVLGMLAGMPLCALTLAAALVQTEAGTTDFLVGGLPPEALDGRDGLLLLGLFGLGSAAGGFLALAPWLLLLREVPPLLRAQLIAVSLVPSGAFMGLKGLLQVLGPDRLAALGAGGILAYAVLAGMALFGLAGLASGDMRQRHAAAIAIAASLVPLGAGLATPHGVIGAGLELVGVAAAALGLLLAAASLDGDAEGSAPEAFAVLLRRRPLALLAYGLGAAALLGAPVGATFRAATHLGRAALETGTLAALIALAGGAFLIPAMLLPPLLRACLEGDRESAPLRMRASLSMLLPAALAAALSFGLMLVPEGLAELCLAILAERR